MGEETDYSSPNYQLGKAVHGTASPLIHCKNFNCPLDSALCGPHGSFYKILQNTFLPTDSFTLCSSCVIMVLMLVIPLGCPGKFCSRSYVDSMTHSWHYAKYFSSFKFSRTTCLYFVIMIFNYWYLWITYWNFRFKAKFVPSQVTPAANVKHSWRSLIECWRMIWCIDVLL